MQFSPEVWISLMKGTEVGSADIQGVSSWAFFTSYIASEVHCSIHSHRWIRSLGGLKSLMIIH